MRSTDLWYIDLLSYWLVVCWLVELLTCGILTCWATDLWDIDLLSHWLVVYWLVELLTCWATDLWDNDLLSYWLVRYWLVVYWLGLLRSGEELCRDAQPGIEAPHLLGLLFLFLLFIQTPLEPLLILGGKAQVLKSVLQEFLLKINNTSYFSISELETLHVYQVTEEILSMSISNLIKMAQLVFWTNKNIQRHSSANKIYKYCLLKWRGDKLPRNFNNSILN